jgi:glycosyltransferase involved in cell wall biosynthesis
VFFRGELITPGGAERVLVEEVKYFEKQGIRTHILTSDFDKKALFNEEYQATVSVVGQNIYSASKIKRILSFPRTVLAIRKRIKEIRPNIILSQTDFECIYLYFATLFTPFSYATHLHDTISWAVGDVRQQAFIYRKAFNEIKESLPGHRQFIPRKPPKVNLIKRITGEFNALLEFIAVRKAKKIFVLSNHQKWEVGKLYDREAVVVRGGFHAQIFDYQPRQDIKQKLGLSNKKIILNINRLMPKKRVDLLIQALKLISGRIEDAVLVIGGTGPEERKLIDLVKSLGIEDKIKFVGYIPDEELWDYYYGCDVFAHPDWLTSAIAPYEALAAGKKVVLSTDMEVPKALQNDLHIIVTEPAAAEMAQALEKALKTRVTGKIDLSEYTWESYCRKIFTELVPIFT